MGIIRQLDITTSVKSMTILNTERTYRFDLIIVAPIQDTVSLVFN